MPEQIETQQVVTKSVVQQQKPVEPEPPQKRYQKKKAIFRTYQVIWYVVGIIEVLLVFRVMLRAFGANAASGFAQFIYAITEPFVMPFFGIFGVSVSEGNILEWSTFFAMIVYLIIAYGIVYFFQLVKPTSPEEVEENV